LNKLINLLLQNKIFQCYNISVQKEHSSSLVFGSIMVEGVIHQELRITFPDGRLIVYLGFLGGTLAITQTAKSLGKKFNNTVSVSA